ncbi:MAG TPA: DUF4062 domain-containing protein [Anaerolineales bacterium]|nr:DUF4062 domain-containing protein [Anaerolineales bacterium]
MVPGPNPTKPNVILTPDSRLRVFISSTLKELSEEREAVRQAILKLRLLPVMFEAGARPHPARELYQAYLSQSHIFIGIYWQSYGWVGPGMELSGLEDEFNLSASLPRLIYVKSPAPDREPGLRHMLERLQQENSASYKRFSNCTELGELVENDLALLLSESYEAASRGPAAELTPKPITNIPFPRNPLLGRAGELEAVCSLLSQETTSLVTLTGPGGTGKSRLALEAALEVRNRFENGVYLVRLTPVTDPERVIPAIAETLGLHQTAQSSPLNEILTNHLRNRSTLLLLDNFEQILAAAPQIAELLEACPRLKILATSRAPLHVRGEKELPVPPLLTPDPKNPGGSEQLSQYASVRLFIQRAQGIRPDFHVTNENAPAIAEICYRLDGLPLAIELAAARIKLLTPQELLARLDKRFDILRGGTRDLPERQQTLRGAIDWSYNLLGENARAVFRRLSVFAGGFSLAAAEVICKLGEDSSVSVLEEIETLLDFSLLLAVEGVEGQPRFGMLESIREYAFERLEESQETDLVQRLQADYYLRFARDVEPRVRTRERSRWSAVLDQDLNNIRAVLEWALANKGGVETGQQLVSTLGYFWALCGHMSEGRRYCERFVSAMNEQTDPAVRASLLSLMGGISLVQGSTEFAVPDLVESIRLARDIQDRQILGTALMWAGAWALSTNEPEKASQQMEEALALFQEAGDQWSEVPAVLWLSNAAQMRGELELSRQLFEGSIVLARKQGDPWLLTFPLIDIAQEAFLAGDMDKAYATLLEADSNLRAVGEQWSRAWVRNALGQIQLFHRDLPAAAGCFAEGLQLARDYGNMVVQIFALVEAAVLVILCNADEASADRRDSELARAAQLCGATKPFVDSPTMLQGIGTRAIFDSLMEQVRSAVEPEVWQNGLREAAVTPFEQSLDLAAAELKKIPH